MRFHLGYYEIRLISALQYLNTRQSELADEYGIDASFSRVLNIGLDAALRVNPFDKELVAVAPAGFPEGGNDYRNFGLLRVNSVEDFPLSPSGPSAILCLDRPRDKPYEFQLPVFYRTTSNDGVRRSEVCPSAVQVGPRIIEDAKAGPRIPEAVEYEFEVETRNGATKIDIFLGISEREGNGIPYLRTILALDDPHREGSQTSRDVARNAYIIVTHTPVTLWDLQDMLRNPEFYGNPRYSPHWALNLVGGTFAGLIYRPLAADGVSRVDVLEGNVEAAQSSMIGIVAKKD